MAAGRYDFEIEQGATFSRLITVRDSSGAIQNLTGYSAAGKIRRKHSDNKEIATFTCTITSATGGQFTFSLTASETSQLPVGPSKEPLECVYDIELTVGSEVYRLLYGICSISPQVTR